MYNKTTISKQAMSIVNATITSNISTKEKIAVLTGVISSRLCFPKCSKEYRELEQIMNLITPIRDNYKKLEGENK